MPTIMVIDDDKHIRDALTVRLGAAAYDVLSADSPESALSAILRQRPDLILLDIEMPRYNGLDFQECLSVAERGREIPIIYLSGAATPANREDAFSQGARAFIAKPFDPQELIATVRGVLRRATSSPSSAA